MTKLEVGSEFPSDAVFQYAAPVDSDAACGDITTFDASKELKGQKFILISVPGAFTQGCHETHLPGYLKHISDLKKAGVQSVLVIASNDAWVMEAWAKTLLKGVDTEGIKFYFASDEECKFSKEHISTLGRRIARSAYLVNDGKVVFAGNDEFEVKKSAFDELKNKL